MNSLPGAIAPPTDRTLTDQVVRQLRKKIILGDLAPGQRLVELRLVEQLDVSRSTVREALRRLEAEGLVNVSSHRGCRVACLDPADAIEICELRAMLEVHAVGYVQLPIDDSVKQPLDQIVRHMGALHFPEDADRFIDLDHAFHRCLISAANRPRTLQVWTSISSLLSTLVALSVRHLSVDGMATARRHQVILDALCQQDKDIATTVIGDHYRSLESQIENIIPARRSERNIG